MIFGYVVAVVLLVGCPIGWYFYCGGPKYFRRRRYYGIQCFFGLPGSGKSYELAAWALAEKEAGRPVFTTPGFAPPGMFREFRSVEDLISIPDGSSIAIDEGQNFLDARGWQSMDPALLNRLTDTRKSDIQLRYTAMEPMMIETTLRRVTFKWWEIRTLQGLVNRKRLAKSPPESPKLQLSNGRWRLVRMRPAVWDVFDTMARSDLSDWSAKRKSKITVPPKQKLRLVPDVLDWPAPEGEPVVDLPPPSHLVPVDQSSVSS